MLGESYGNNERKKTDGEGERTLRGHMRQNANLWDLTDAALRAGES